MSQPVDDGYMQRRRDVLVVGEVSGPHSHVPRSDCLEARAHRAIPPGVYHTSLTATG